MLIGIKTKISTYLFSSTNDDQKDLPHILACIRNRNLLPGQVLFLLQPQLLPLQHADRSRINQLQLWCHSMYQA